MASVKKRFEGRTSILTAFHDWILNQPAGFDKRMTLATDRSSLVIAYLPSTSAAIITMSTTGLPGLGCSWTAKWYNPIDNVVFTSDPCQTGVNQITLKHPGCVITNADCDWVLELTRGSSSLSATSSVPSGQRVDTWSQPSMSGDTSEIRLAVSSSVNLSTASSSVISPASFGQQGSPKIAPLRKGYMVAWQADRLDGSLFDVFAQQVDGSGALVGSRTQVNLTSFENQRDPAIAVDALGNGLIVWSSYGQDGDKGGIFARHMDPTGQLVGHEIAINSRSAGHQEKPQVIALPGGRFVVAWQTRAEEVDPGSVSFRILDATGTPISSEVAMPGTSGLVPCLANLEATPAGTFHLEWALADFVHSGSLLYSRTYDSAGLALGPATSLP
jgi:hypothetical protein